MKKVGIVMGSDSDLSVVEKAITTLEKLEIHLKLMYFLHTGPQMKHMILHLMLEKKISV